jgi:hypothetical protein
VTKSLILSIPAGQKGERFETPRFESTEDLFEILWYAELYLSGSPFSMDLFFISFMDWDGYLGRGERQ